MHNKEDNDFFFSLNQEESDGRSMLHVWCKRERGIRHFDGKMLKKHHFEDPGKYGRIIFKKKYLK
jgi:hypothetical protein